MIDPIAVLEHLKNRPGFSLIEAYHVSRFKGHRQKKDGSLQSFTLIILDGGSTVQPLARYTCKIETEDGRRVQGNPSESLIGALYILQNVEMD